MSALPKTGVVLAAGFGSRLKGVVASTDLKPLTPVAGTPLIVRTLNSLETAGCTRVVIVLGHHAGVMEAGIRTAYDGPLDLVFALNERYAKQNGLSVLAARFFVDGPFILTMADHVFGDEVMDLAGRYTPEPGHAALLVDFKLATIFDMDDATKAVVEDGKIVAIDKTLSDFNAVDTGVFVCTDGLMDALQALDEAHGDASLSDGVRHLAASGRMHALDIGDGFWQDVDTPEMMAHAETMLA
ncbi:MAG: NTP transferase domain-containing protein [Rhodothermaceae bacterium]|nr:NTP transferase domain-containing protein [Rhodothermaceae bacterium]